MQHFISPVYFTCHKGMSQVKIKHRHVRKVAKKTYEYVLSVRPSVRTYQLGSHWADLLEIWYWRLLLKESSNVNHGKEVWLTQSHPSPLVYVVGLVFELFSWRQCLKICLKNFKRLCRHANYNFTINFSPRNNTICCVTEWVTLRWYCHHCHYFVFFFL
jgi:hypothetical protein